MKTTLDIDDDLLLAAKQRAVELGTTLQALVEEGLRREVARRAGPPRRTPAEVAAALHGLRGTVLRYDDPTEPVDPEA